MVSLALLALAASFQGQVVDPAGAPVAGARVTLRSAQQVEASAAVSQADGRFELDGIPGGDYLLHVERPGFAPWSGVARVTAEPREPFLIRLSVSPVRAEVTVSAEGGTVEDLQSVPSRVNVINRGVIAERAVTGLSEAVDGEAGVAQQRTVPGMGAVQIRGLTGKGVSVYRDGVRYTTAAQRGGVSTFFNLTEASHLETLELLRGPNGAQYGSDGLGGVVAASSRAATFSSHLAWRPGTASVFYQSANNGLGAQTSGAVSTSRLAVLYSLTGQRVNTLRAGNGLDTHAAVTRFLGIPSDILGERLSDTAFTQYGGSIHTQAQLTPLSHLVLHYERGQIDGAKRSDQLLGGDGNLIADLRNLMLDFGYLRWQRFNAGPFQQFWVSGSYNTQREERVNQGGQGNPNATITHQYERTKAWGAQAQAERRWTRNVTLIGGDAYFERMVSPAFTTRPSSAGATASRPRVPDGARYDQAGVFLQHAWEASSRLRVSGALRWSGAWYDVEASDLWPADSLSTSALSGRLGAVWRAGEQWSFHGQYSRGFRAPNMTDLGSLGLQGNGFFEVAYKDVEGRGGEVGNSSSSDAHSTGEPVAALSPETSDGFEGGVTFRTNRLRAEVTAFRMNLGNSIVSRTLILPQGAVGSTLGGEPVIRQLDSGAVFVEPAPNAVLTRANSGGANFAGVEQLLQVRLSPSWTFNENLTWVQAEDSDTGLPPDIEPGVPAPAMNVTLLFAPASRKYWLEFYGTAADRQDRLSSLALQDRRIGATRSRSNIASFFNNGAAVRGLVRNGVLVPTGETVAQVQQRVLGTAQSAAMFTAIPGYAVFGVRCGLPVGSKSDLLVDLSNLTDRGYRGVGWGADAAGFDVTVKWKFRL